MKRRIEYIDLTKAVAILLVVIGHVIYFCISRENYDFCKQFLLYDLLSNIEMPLFVFASALVSKCSIDTLDLGKDLYKKFRTLIVPFLIFGCLFALFSGSTLSHFAQNTMKIGYWYLLMLFELQILNYAFLFFCHAIEKMKCSLLLEIIFVLAVYALLFFTYRGIDPEAIDWKNTLSLLKLKQYYLMFAGIIIIRRHGLQEKLLFSQQLFTISIVLSLSFLFCDSIGEKHWCFNIMKPWVYSISVMYIIKQLANNQWFMKSGGNVLLIIGRYSMDIYVIHFFFINSMDLSGIAPVMNRFPNIICNMIVAVPIAFIIICCSMALGKIIRSSTCLNKLIFYK